MLESYSVRVDRVGFLGRAAAHIIMVGGLGLTIWGVGEAGYAAFTTPDHENYPGRSTTGQQYLTARQENTNRFMGGVEKVLEGPAAMALGYMTDILALSRRRIDEEKENPLLAEGDSQNHFGAVDEI